LQVEQVHLRAQLAVVALGGFLKAQQMRVELLLVQPAGAIDARKHRVLLVAAPIGARHARQLEGRRVQLAGAGQVRPAAHIQPVIARPVDGQILIARQFGGPFGLEGFALLLPAADQRFAAPHFAAQRLVGGDDLAHFRLDGGQVFVGEGAVLRGEIVVETIVRRRAEGDLRAGNSACTASARICAKSWRASSSASFSSLLVTSASDASPVKGRVRSTSSPSMRAAIAAFARPGQSRRPHRQGWSPAPFRAASHREG
jgi:hypothetical protein